MRAKRHEEEIKQRTIDITPNEESGLSVWDSTIILTSRAIGTGFLFFPSHQEYTTFLTSNESLFLTQHNDRHPTIDLHLLIKCLLFTCRLRDSVCSQRFLVIYNARYHEPYSNFQEIGYFLGGGRASIFFISSIIILTFALYPAYYFRNY